MEICLGIAIKYGTTDSYPTKYKYAECTNKRKAEQLCGWRTNLCPDNWIDKRPDGYDRHSTRHSAIMQYLRLTASIPISQGLCQ